MSLLTPITGLILAAAVLPPLILLYFLKLRRRSQAIACTLLWQRSVEDLQANAPFQRLRRSLLLFLQLLVLLLLALSVAQPRLHAGTRRGGKLVVLIDNSASMLATDVEGEPTRLDEAKRQARERIESLYGGGLFSDSPGETMVIAFSNRAEVLCRFTDSKRQILDAIDRIRPTHAETSVDQALKLARAYTTNVVDAMGEARPVGEAPTLELYSDGRIIDLDTQVLRGETLNYYPIGDAEPSNAAITSISVERPFDRPSAVQVFVSIANYSSTPTTSDVQLSVDGAARSIQEISLVAATRDEESGVLTPGRKNVVFSPFEQPRGAVIEVAVLREDDLAADNIAQLVVAPAKQLRVMLMAESYSPPSKLVLEGMALQELVHVRDPQRFEDMAGSGALDQYDVVVVDGYEPKLLPPARYLVFGPPPPVEGLNPFGEGEADVVLDWRDESPMMKFVTLDNLYISRRHLVEPADDVRIIAEGSQGPLMVAVSRGPMQLVYCAFDPLDSNWPLLRGWVNFVVNTVDVLGQSGEAITSRGFVPGEALTARLPATARNIELVTPDGQTVRQQPVDPSLWSWGPARLSGVHQLSWEEGGSDREGRPLAVNLVSDLEGDLQRQEVIRIGQQSVS
ncbi:MAG: VWA domain-containing protein, partial [Planctomycetota bacterium]